MNIFCALRSKLTRYGAAAVRKSGITRSEADCARTALIIGGHEIELRLDNKHEIAYLDKSRSGIDDVDVAVAHQLLRPGDLVLDLGANIGYVSLHYLAQGAREVHAFEPSPEIFSRLESLRAPGLHSYNLAIGDRLGQGALILSSSHHQGSTLYPEVVEIRPKVYGEHPASVLVEIRTIDDLFPLLRFDYVKVDIEGGELDFVRGAVRMLKERPPRVLSLEIKPEFRTEYLAALESYFSCVRRVDYDRNSGRIRFMEVDAASVGPFLNSPPNYIFSNDESIFR
ncbi:FkbM family methyltransferase [Methyloversatilis sp. XJ19-49]|uniref:FkbM family methyltransferase n=1 Tax=Methyloversatilis sp. XJ19-49 TaxID=2963429 RepID=UPI00211D0DA2|nr:FkbM family methyltransferase [Methyloversatilis sp. XJ19-49]MCQ9378576.1 FkbM family methyltransferase [Methyloversatilis sp. XJ19-49]